MPEESPVLNHFAKAIIVSLVNMITSQPMTNYYNQIVGHNGDRLHFKKRPYDGSAVSFFTNVSRNALSIGLNNYLVSTYTQQNGKPLSEYVKAMFSLLSGSLAGCLLNPLEATAQIQRASEPKALPALQIINEAYKIQGIAFLHLGANATIGRTVGFALGYSWLQPYVNSELKKHLPNELLANLLSLLSSAGCTAILTNPFQVLRSKKHAFFNSPQPTPSYSQLMKSPGWWYDGLSIRWVHLNLSMIIMFTTAAGVNYLENKLRCSFSP